jgi:hypothetical protein
MLNERDHLTKDEALTVASIERGAELSDRPGPD